MTPGILVERSCPRTQVLQLGLVRRRPRVQHHHGGHRLAPLRVGDPDHRGLGHGRMRHEHRLDLPRRNVLPTPHDHVVQPAVDVEEPVGVEPPGVAGPEPPVGGQDGAADVLAGHLLAPHPDLALLARGDDRVVLAAHLHLQGRQRPTHRAQPRPHHRVGRSERLAVVVRRQHGDGRRRLGQPVGVDQIDVRHVAQRPLDQLQRHAPAAVRQVPQRSAPTPADSTASRIRPSIVGTTMACVIVSDTARRTHSAASNVGRYMIRRPAYKDDSTAATPAMWYGGTQISCASSAQQPRNSTERDDVGHKMPVPQHRRLGLRRRPAGEQQHADLLGVDEGELERSAPVHRRHRLVDRGGELVLRHHVRRRRSAPSRGTSSASAIIRPPSTRGDDPLQLLVGRSVIDRRERQPGQRRAEQRHRQHVGVQPEVTDDLGAALLEVQRPPAGTGRADPRRWCPRHESRLRRGRGHPRPPSRASMAMFMATDIPAVSPRRAAAWRPYLSGVSPTEIDPSPALVHRSSSPSSSSA